MGVTDTFATLDVVVAHAAATAQQHHPRTLADHVMKALGIVAVSGFIAFVFIVFAVVARWVAALTGVWPLHG